MTQDKQYVLDTMRAQGLAKAQALQETSPEMTGTELYAEEDYIPDFQAAKAQKNMLERPVGFACRSTAGRVVRLLQPYNSTIYTQEPEELPAQWGFVWSTDRRRLCRLWRCPRARTTQETAPRRTAMCSGPPWTTTCGLPADTRTGGRTWSR